MRSPANTDPWPWPDSLDAAKAAPAHHTLLFENEQVRVFDTRIAPGDVVPLHTHRWPSVIYVLSESDFVRRDEEGAVTLDSRPVAKASQKVTWLPALPPHTLENIGDREIHIVSVELKESGNWAIKNS